MMRQWMAPLAASALVLSAVPAVTVAAAPPAEWDGLVRVDSKRLALVYLLPGTDFRPYTKVMIDTPEVAFRKNWVRDYNSDHLSLTRQISTSDADKIKHRASDGFDKILIKAYQDAGYQVVQAPGPDVVLVRPGVLDLEIAAPDTMSPGMSVTWAVDAGEATVVLEARDSITNALLGRAVDRREAGDAVNGMPRSSVSNQADFAELFRRWAKASADGLTVLKAESPVAGEGFAER
jgi:hypothetical protein